MYAPAAEENSQVRMEKFCFQDDVDKRKNVKDGAGKDTGQVRWSGTALQDCDAASIDNNVIFFDRFLKFPVNNIIGSIGGRVYAQVPATVFNFRQIHPYSLVRHIKDKMQVFFFRFHPAYGAGQQSGLGIVPLRLM